MVSLRDQLRAFEFNHEQGNWITTERIQHAVEFLNSPMFEGQTISRHLIIVGASMPVEAATHASAFYGNTRPIGLSSWHSLASLLCETNTHCHLVLSHTPQSNPLNTMFDEMLRLKGKVEADSWFPLMNEGYIVRMSAEQAQCLNSPSVAYSYPQPPQVAISSVRRNNSYPTDLSSLNMRDFEPPVTEHTPTLVAQLQQAHGLSKKRIYGTKAPPESLFRNERVRERSTTLPTLFAPPRTSLSERLVRSSQSSPTDAHPRMQSRWHTNRRGSRFSSPETEALASPTSLSPLSEVSTASEYFSSGISTPLSPTTSSAPSIVPCHKVQGMPSPFFSSPRQPPPPTPQSPVSSREAFAASIINGIHGGSSNVSPSQTTPLAPFPTSTMQPVGFSQLPVPPPGVLPPVPPTHVVLQDRVESRSRSTGSSRPRRRRSIDASEELFDFNPAEYKRSLVEFDKILAEHPELADRHKQPASRRSSPSRSSSSSYETNESINSFAVSGTSALALSLSMPTPPLSSDSYSRNGGYQDYSYTFAPPSAATAPQSSAGYAYDYDYPASYIPPVSTYMPVTTSSSSLAGWAG
ncbi:hypothetical protein HGRIS_010904 [Hohenbuehelia grisea]